MDEFDNDFWELVGYYIKNNSIINASLLSYSQIYNFPIEDLDCEIIFNEDGSFGEIHFNIISQS